MKLLVAAEGRVCFRYLYARRGDHLWKNCILGNHSKVSDRFGRELGRRVRGQGISIGYGLKDLPCECHSPSDRVATGLGEVVKGARE